MTEFIKQQWVCKVEIGNTSPYKLRYDLSLDSKECGATFDTYKEWDQHQDDHHRKKD